MCETSSVESKSWPVGWQGHHSINQRDRSLGAENRERFRIFHMINGIWTYSTYTGTGTVYSAFTGISLVIVCGISLYGLVLLVWLCAFGTFGTFGMALSVASPFGSAHP